MTAERAATLPTRRSAVNRHRPAARPATREADAAGVLVSDTFAAEAVRALRVAMGPSAEFREGLCDIPSHSDKYRSKPYRSGDGLGWEC